MLGWDSRSEDTPTAMRDLEVAGQINKIFRLWLFWLVLFKVFNARHERKPSFDRLLQRLKTDGV
jgi:hypothetical protein